jgi:hypothetical protein
MLTILGRTWVYRVAPDPLARTLWRVEGIDRARPENNCVVTFSGPRARDEAERYAMMMSSRR